MHVSVNHQESKRNDDIKTQSRGIISRDLIKKVLNDSKARFLLGSSAGLAGTGSAVWFLNYLLTNKERIVNGLKLSIAYQNWIRDNMILFLHDGFLCWHNTFMQFLACPEIRCRSYDFKDIMVMINYINSQFKKNYKGDCLSIRPINVDMKFRRAGFESKELASKEAGGWILCSPDGFDKDYTELGIIDEYLCYDCISPIDKNTLFKDDEIRNFILNYEKYKNINGIVNNKRYAENFLLRFTRDFILGKKAKNKKFCSHDINFFKEQNFFATFVMVRNINYTPPHWYSYYVVYDKNKKIKFFLRADDLKTSWQVTSENDFLKDLENCNIAIVKYSTGSIVEKYYTPEKIYDVN